MFRKDISYPHACLSNMEKDIFQLVAQPDDLSHIWISIACLPSLTFFRGNYIRSVQLKMRLNFQKVESPSEMSNGLRLLNKKIKYKNISPVQWIGRGLKSVFFVLKY